MSGERAPGGEPGRMYAKPQEGPSSAGVCEEQQRGWNGESECVWLRAWLREARGGGVTPQPGEDGAPTTRTWLSGHHWRIWAEQPSPEPSPLILIWCLFRWTVPRHTDGGTYRYCFRCCNYSHSDSASTTVNLRVGPRQRWEKGPMEVRVKARVQSVGVFIAGW